MEKAISEPRYPVAFHAHLQVKRVHGFASVIASLVVSANSCSSSWRSWGLVLPGRHGK